MKKKIDEMSKEEQYREYIKAHSNSDAINAERKYLRDQEKEELKGLDTSLIIKSEKNIARITVRIIERRRIRISDLREK